MVLAAIFVAALVLAPFVLAIVAGLSIRRERLPPGVRSLDEYRSGKGGAP
jgi:hypothetical protein